MTEVLTASTLSVLVILLIGKLDLTHLLLSNRARENAVSSAEVGMALSNMGLFLRQADRVKIICTGDPASPASRGPNCAPANIQFRYVNCPTPSCFDVAANYRWAQYRLEGTELRFYDNTGAPVAPCNVDGRFFDIDGFTIQYRNETLAPPGGDPSIEDNNVLELVATVGISPQPIRRYTSEVTIRAAAYSNVNTGATGAGDSGTGLAPSGVSNPPDPCS